MRTVSEDGGEKHGDDAGGGAKLARQLRPRLAELWIFLVIVTFFVIRVLGSHFGQRLLGSLSRKHLP